MQKIAKISVIGNAGGGKSFLSRRLAQIYSLPLTHVDAIQFLSGMKIRPHQESIAMLRQIQAEPQWIIDGFGPLDILVERLKLSEKIIFIDFPLWRHSWWCTKRQVHSLFGFRREELPEGCEDANFAQTLKLYKTLWQVHSKMRPEMKRILARDEFKDRVSIITSLREFRKISHSGI